MVVVVVKELWESYVPLCSSSGHSVFYFLVNASHKRAVVCILYRGREISSGTNKSVSIKSVVIKSGSGNIKMGVKW